METASYDTCDVLPTVLWCVGVESDETEAELVGVRPRANCWRCTSPPLSYPRRPTRLDTCSSMSSRLHGIAERAGELYRDWEARYVALNSRAKVILWIWVALHVVGAGLFWLIEWENIFACQSTAPSDRVPSPTSRSLT